MTHRRHECLNATYYYESPTITIRIPGTRNNNHNKKKNNNAIVILMVLIMAASTLVARTDGFLVQTTTTTIRRHPTFIFTTSDGTPLHNKQQQLQLQLPDMNSYAAGYQTVFTELPSQSCTPSMGCLPSDLTGTYFRVGPAMFSAGSIMPPKTSIVQPKKGPPVPDGQLKERMVTHPFDADGGVLAVTFCSNNNTAVSRFRYVRTNAFTKERKAGQRMYTAMDTTRTMGAGRGNDLILPLFRHHLQPGLNKYRKNTSNTRVMVWANKVLTLWEGGLPYKLDMLALSTEGRSQLGGILKEEQPMGGKAVYDSKRDRMVMYANQPDARSSKLTLYEFNAKFKLTNEVTTELPGFALLSDFALTQNYYIFVQPPVTVNAMKFMFNKEPGNILELQQGPSTLHLIPRDGSRKVQKSLSIPFDGVLDADLQFINAFEQDDGILVVDAIRLKEHETMKGPLPPWPWASSLDAFQRNTCQRSLVRYRVSKDVVSKEILFKSQCYFGGINPALSSQRHRYIYMAIGSMEDQVAPPQGIARFDTETKEVESWMPQAHEFCGEPMYAKSQTSTDNVDDGGYLLSVLFNGTSSDLVVLRANNVAAGPIARVPLGLAVPHGLYGCYTDEGEFSFEEIDRRAKLADKMESRGNMWNEVKSDFSGLGLRLDDFEEYFGDMM